MRACSVMVKQVFPNAKISYSFEYGAAKVSRAAGSTS